MKKIFLIGFMIVALLSVFAISVFADDIVVSKTESEEYGTVIQLNADPGLDEAVNYVSTLNKINDAGTDKDALCILTDGAETPSYYVFPSSYIVDEREDGKFDLTAAELATAIADFNTANSTSYYADYAIDGSGASKRLNSMVRFVFPSSVVSASDSVCCMMSYSSLIEIRINHAIDFSSAAKMFYSNKNLASVIGFEKVDGTKLPKTMFAGCSALRYIKLPTNTVKIPGSFFQGANGVNVVNMEELTQLTIIDSWAFDGTQNLVITLPDSVTTLNTSAFESAFKQGGSITINPTSQLTTIGNKAFAGSVKLNSLYIPSSVTTIGENAFNGSGVKTLDNFENCQITIIKKGTFEAASNLTSIKIPETVTTIEDAFRGNKNLKTVYIPASVTSIADTFVKSSWSEAPANIVFIYIGKDASVLSACTKIANATVIPVNEYNEGTAYTGANIVVGYSRCLAYNNGVHDETKIKLIEVISYCEPITIHNECVECALETAPKTILPLFTCFGFSTPADGRDGLVISFSVDSEAIAEYTSITGKSFKYGAFAAAEKNIGTNDVVDSSGNAADYAICAELSDYGFASFDLVILGFGEDQKDLGLAMGAYVIDGDTVSYMQAGTPNDGAKYYFASYNTVMDLIAQKGAK